MELEDTVRIVKEALEIAKKKMEERGGTLEGWLWYILTPPIFLSSDKTIRVEYWSNDGSVKHIIIINKDRGEIIKALEEFDDTVEEDE